MARFDRQQHPITPSPERMEQWWEKADKQLSAYSDLLARPKPLGLAEQALEALEQIDGLAVANMNHLSIYDDLVTGVEAIRRALERLQELEKGNE